MHIFQKTLSLIFLICGSLAAIIAAPCLAVAQTPKGELTLEDVLTKVAEGNPALAAKATAASALDGRVEQAGKHPNPTLSLAMEDFGGSGRTRGGESMELTMQASQLIERGDKPARRIALASGERAVAKQELSVKQNETLAASASAFIRALTEQARLGLAADQLKLAQETADSVERRRAASVAGPAESARARAALAGARAEHARANAAWSSAVGALAATWGGARSDVSRIRGALRIPDAPPSLAELEFSAHNPGGPRLALLASELEARRAAVELERARAVTDVTLGAGMRRLYEGPDVAFVMGASFPLRFRDDNSGNIREAQTMVRAAEQSLQAAENEQRAALSVVWIELSAAHAQAADLRRDALPAAEEACAAILHSYERGLAAFVDVVDARRALLAIRRDILDAESTYAAALVKAEALAGSSFIRTRTLLRAE